ncbi:MAG: transcription termination factor NusA [Candidatus Promineofilum sp.]|nr:transcription termination factor NusA [Promineifilum sp.]MCW5865201.1 transcription termination/antitermination protein NusA [Anaerolineae bacterium]
MKSEFILAFNEICESRGLPKEDVFEALKTALVSAYRRDANLSSNQHVTVEIDPRTGEPTIFTEKEVVDDVLDNRTEVTLTAARKEGHTTAELGDVVMIDSTTESFGRIAAQTAKQVLLQRVREAEREHLFEDFSGREGELVNGTVQSISGQHITIGLGRTEAMLPKSQQVQGERYRAHDKIRVYVLEVRRTSRGPQIVVSRNHRNLLRRLLELEVPEIYNGQVEIKSIAREAGQRSKVAVQALQHGVDPVGACVGMRGVRIQSIVRELNDEKIDVIEWDGDQRVFIAKALSPARVSHVFLEEHPEEGKTAVVIVPDDQLSLAIGREGQNARLAAKLTGWRIDIKNLTEAASEALNNLDHPSVDPRIAKDATLMNQVRNILDKKQTGRPITAEDYQTLDRLVANVEGRIMAQRAQEYDVVRKQRAELRKRVPGTAWEQPLDVLDLPGRIHNLLLDTNVNTVGDLIYILEMGDDYFLKLRGLGEKALETVKETLAAYQSAQIDAVAAAEAAETAPAELLDEITPAMPEEIVEEVLEVESLPVIDRVVQVEDMVTAVPDIVLPEEEEEMVFDDETLDRMEIAGVLDIDEVEPEVEETLTPIDDLSAAIFVKEEAPAKPEPKKKPAVVVVRPAAEESAEEEAKRKKRKGQPLVYNEELNQVVVDRKRKGGKHPGWEDEDLEI